MAKKTNSLIDIDMADELDKDIAFCRGVIVIMQGLSCGKIGDNSALAEVANIDSGGLAELLDQTHTAMCRIKLALSRVEKAD